MALSMGEVMGESIAAADRRRPPCKCRRALRRSAVAAAASVLLNACSRDEQPPEPAPSATVAPVVAASQDLPKLLYLPDGNISAPPSAPSVERPPSAVGRCPPDMVSVRHFCIDRFEAQLVSAESGALLSPYYPPSRRAAIRSRDIWGNKRHRVGDTRARMMPIPELPSHQTEADFSPLAKSVRAVVPHGYVSGDAAEVACENAGKRLCTEKEWETACRGENDQQFPYGAEYEAGRCNVFRPAHPAMVLHDNPSIGHSDPRLNLVKYRGKPLLRKTGATESCASRWGDDAVYDMVGNLDEWVDDPKGVFRGGFFSRSSKVGCDKRVSAHTRNYNDYSTGVRCCR